MRLLLALTLFVLLPGCQPARVAPLPPAIRAPASQAATPQAAWEREVRERVTRARHSEQQRQARAFAAVCKSCLEVVRLSVLPEEGERAMLVAPIFTYRGAGGGGGGTPPDPPTSVSAMYSTGTTNVVYWTDSANEDHYELERNDNGGSYSLIASPVANATSYNDTAGVSGHTYIYRLRSANITSTAFSAWVYSMGVTVP